MEAYAEGLNIIASAGVGLAKVEVNAETAPLRHPELYAYDINVAEVAEVWRRGSVVSSWLLDLAASALRKSPHLDNFAGRADHRRRYAFVDRSLKRPTAFADKLLSALRYEFGGHDEKAAPDLPA
jgi:6-phosphogluconate dehydrogenase